MAHVLLPCELPFWPEVRAQISALRNSRNVGQVITVLRAIYRICSAAVEQVDEERASEDAMRFDLCEAFLEDFEDTQQLLDVILPTVVSFAGRIEDCRPPSFVYSLQAEEGSWNLSREFVASLLAHSLLSTFPLRTLRSHPTLQDFNRCSIYRFLTLDQHKRFLTNLLRYFKEVRSQMDGHIRVRRRLLSRCPPLTEWVCGTTPLCPLTVRHVASINEAEPHLYRVFPVNAELAVLKHVKCAENDFLLEHPELSVLQLFCEALRENEVLVVEGLRPLRVQSKLKATTNVVKQSKSRKTIPLLPSEEYKLNSYDELGRLGLLDAMTFDREFLYRQYLDETLIYNLNKCLNAFQQATRTASLLDQASACLSTTALNDPESLLSPPSPQSLPVLDEGASRTMEQAKRDGTDPATNKPMHRCPHMITALSKAGESASDQSHRNSLTSDRRPSDGVVTSAGTSVECPRCVFTLGSTSASDVRLSPLGRSCSTSSSSFSEDDNAEDRRSSHRCPEHSGEAAQGSRAGAKPPPGGLARHLLTDHLLVTQALINSPKHPSPRPRKRTVSGSTSTGGANDSEATLLSRPVGQPLILPMPPQGTFTGGPLNIALLAERSAGMKLISRAQMVLSEPPVSSPRRVPSIQSEDSRGSFRTDSGEQMSSAQRGTAQALGHSAQRSEDQDPVYGSSHSKKCQLHRTLSRASRASSFKTTLSKRYSRQVSAEDDYFTAEESFDEDEEYLGFSKASKTVGAKSLRKRRWRTGRSRSTFDSEIEGQQSMQSSFDHYTDKPDFSRSLRREDSAGSAGFVLEHRSGYSRRSESDIASSAGRLFYRNKAERMNSQYMSVDSTPANCTCAVGCRLKGRRYHRQMGGLRVTQGQSSRSRSLTHRSLDRRHSSDCSSCCGSSMEDIVEDAELLSPMLDILNPFFSPLLIRRANSEPSLILSSISDRFPGGDRSDKEDGSRERTGPEERLRVQQPTTVSHAGLGSCRLRSPILSTWVNGRVLPKAYSFDGVSPNLPVPFKAKFRIRKKRSPSAEGELAARHALTKEDLDYIKRVVREDNRPRSLTESQDSSRIHEIQWNNELNQKISPSLAEGPGRMLPVACTRWTTGIETETDAQLEALSLWLAASAAKLPHLVIYTHGESRLQHLGDVCAKAMERGWLCGDLAGELVRFCRNKMSIHKGVGKVSTEMSLFMQILQPKPQ